MTRRERVCRTLPSWSLRRILASSLAHEWWTTAYLELWKREVEDELLAATDDESGPWLCVMPRGMH